ncbi:hypothetical protein NIES2101_21170 [Calothrix sp. HK-06]|nr:hypothetical protein NIES2101_21170 [Calothrix sp. HK-06]
MDKLAALSVEFTPTIAQDPSTEPFLLELIALYGDVELRQAVASNPNTPSKILFALADEFPGEFFNNPVFPLLTLENPDFLILFWNIQRRR